MSQRKALIPTVWFAWLGNLLRALGHGTKAIEIGASALEDSATSIKELTRLSLGAKAKQLAEDLAIPAQSKETEEE
jgi:hypothetical protein